MQYFIFGIIALLFTYFNVKIIINDFKEKKIPNKYLVYLLYLLPFYYIYFLLYVWNINFISIFLQLMLSLIISFTLYYYNIWNAWDAKYLLILSLFIPNIWIITFIWNVALLTIIYLILYFLYFYFWKCLISWKYTKSLYQSIFLDLKWKFKNFIKSTDWNIYKKTVIYKIVRWIGFFTIIFVSIRLFRLYIIQNYIIEKSEKDINWWIIWFLIKISLEYHIYLLFILIWFYWTLYIVYQSINYIKSIITKNLKDKKNSILIDIFLFIILISILWSYIIYEYINNPIEISNNLKRIFTLYLIIYITIKILIYAYKVTFQVWEEYYIDIKKLKAWNIVDKEYLINLFWTQSILWAPWEKQNKEWLLYPDPKKYFLDLPKTIDEDSKDILIKVFEIVNKYHLNNKTSWFNEIKTIKILKTFSFWIYIVIWFVISFIIWDSIYRYLISVLFEYLKIKS